MKFERVHFFAFSGKTCSGNYKQGYKTFLAYFTCCCNKLECLSQLELALP
jgi:hypothetical protein